MTSFMYGFLGVLLAFIVLILSIYLYIRKTLGKRETDFLMKSLKDIGKQEKEDYSRIKDIGGMTSLYAPKIREDFPTFSKELFFNKVEYSLRTILTALDQKDPSLIPIDHDMDLIKGIVANTISDHIYNNIDIHYKDIIFHKHAITSYEKEKGTAIIKVKSSVGCYYETNEDKRYYPDVRKETRYESTFIYVYDETQFKDYEYFWTMHCPNCGAPIKKIGLRQCAYCGSFLVPINMKSWKIAEYKEC